MDRGLGSGLWAYQSELLYSLALGLVAEMVVMREIVATTM